MPPFFKNPVHARILAAAAMFGLSLAQAGPLDGLEMDVLDAHETPVRATSRIVLPHMPDDERDYGVKRAAVIEPRGSALERSIEVAAPVAAPAEPEPVAVAAQKPAPEPELGSTVSAAGAETPEDHAAAKPEQEVEPGTADAVQGAEGIEAPGAAETPEMETSRDPPADAPAVESPARAINGT